MVTKGQATKDRLLDIAERHILLNGFAATSIEDLISEAGITKGGFFYHFDGKNALAYALMHRYREQEALLFSGLFKRADMLSAIIEGGIIISRALNTPSILVMQLLEYRSYIGLLYGSPVMAQLSARRGQLQ